MASIAEAARAAKFLLVGPMVLAILAVIYRMTTPGFWWVQWAALGMGIAWMISLRRVLRAVVVIGGVAALLAYLRKRQVRRLVSSWLPASDSARARGRTSRRA
jgi:hypothetical protein